MAAAAVRALRQPAGRQTGGRQIKTTLLVSAHCATLIAFYFLIGWLLQAWRPYFSLKGKAPWVTGIKGPI